MKLLITLGILFITATTFSQKAVIKVLSSNNNVVPYTHICLEYQGEKDYCVGSEKGISEIHFKGNTIISISSVGYKTLIDTITEYKKQYVFHLKEKVYQSDAVVVTGQYKAVSKDNSIYNIKIIDSKKIENVAANNLGELLESELNINIKNDPSTGSSIDLFGIGGENVKILIDGVPVIGRLDGNIDLSQINLENVEHIEIVEGPMSVSYGSNALGGVINIITKQNKYAKFSTAINTYYESVGQYNISALVDFKKKKNNFSFNASRKFFSGFSLNDSLRGHDWKPKEQYNGGFKYIYNSKKLKIKNNMRFFKERLLNKGELIAPYYEKAYDSWFHTQRFTENIQLTKELNNNTALNINAAYSFYTRERRKYLKDLTNLNSILTDNTDDHDTTSFHNFMLRALINNYHKDNKLNYQLGIDLNHEFAIGRRIENGGSNIGDYAAFAGLQYLINKKFVLQPALRYSYNTKYDAPLTPSFNIKYKLKEFDFRLSYARGFRAPSIKELNLNFFDSNHQIEGNENLKAERSHNFNFSLNYNNKLFKKPAEFRIRTFYNKINNMISLVQVNPDNALYYRNENIGIFENKGFIFDFSYKLAYFLNLKLGYSYTGNKDALYSDIDYIYSSAFNSNINFKLFQNSLNLSVFYKYNGSMPQYFYNDDSELDIYYSDAYHNLDLSLNKSFFKRKLKLGAGVKNIFDNKEINMIYSGSSHGGNGSSLVGWGRTFFISLSYKFYKY